MSALRTGFAATAALAAGLTIGHVATDGFDAYTLESARRLQALRSPASVGTLALDRADGGRISLGEMPGRVLLVDFVYTHCTTYCSVLGGVYAQLQQRLADRIAAGDVRLVSVSFDTERDSPAALQAYRAHHASGARGWDLGTPSPSRDLDKWLSGFGVVVIPDGVGGFAHNAAVHVIGPDRRLVAILDPDDIDGVVKTAEAVLAARAHAGYGAVRNTNGLVATGPDVHGTR